MKVNKVKGKLMNFWVLLFFCEMLIYVLKMLVLGDLIKNSKKYGINLFDIDKDCVLVWVDVG